MSSLLVCYLIFTSFLNFKANGRVYSLGLMAMGPTAMTGYLWVEYQVMVTGVAKSDAPSGAGYAFAAILFAALIGDTSHLVKNDYTRMHSVVRHLWRMCFAFFMAATSFFLARSHLFPDFFLESGLLYFGLAPLIMMVYWSLHTYIMTAWRKRSRLASS